MRPFNDPTSRCRPQVAGTLALSLSLFASFSALAASGLVQKKDVGRTADGHIDAKNWDDGVTAARLQYDANAYRAKSGEQSSMHGYVGLNGGVNLGAWRFRHSGSLSGSDSSGYSYQSVLTNVQRGINSMKSQLVLGDANTDGTIFDSVGVRGAQLFSDDRMFPKSRRGYAPVVRGIASSNARVQIRQNGKLLRETTVAAGAFEINDLHPTDHGGDLEVVVNEADGRVRVSRVPYAAAVNSLRPGSTRHAFTLGQFRDADVESTPMMAQGTLQHGFNNLVTGYGGLTAMQGYSAGVAGVALNSALGGFGADVTFARTQFQDLPDRNGKSVRLSYSKLLQPTNTKLTIAAYRYSSRGYFSLLDAVAMRDLERRRSKSATRPISQGKLQLTLDQSFPEGYGSFYASGSAQTYWSRNGVETQFQMGYSNTYKRLDYGVSAVREYNPLAGKWDSRVMVNLSIPLGKGSTAAKSTTTAQRDRSGNTSIQQSLTRAASRDSAFAYDLSAGRSSGSERTTDVAANVAYSGSMATVTANASKSNAHSQVGAGVSGTVVAYPGGAAFTREAGDTIAIVEAKDATAARAANGNRSRVGPRGRAIVSDLTPYATNQIDIQPGGLTPDARSKTTKKPVAPTSGAVVVLNVESEKAG
ncbi:fimbria/pilus outer membrane usher protein [Variovorax sp. GT1P44]|uniref:fimbria/pilus outer membrane usher protein n=1 Tax=Variovorax sp. GT1P44 TaxID=3443742 RepID=UPI003F46AF01